MLSIDRQDEADGFATCDLEIADDCAAAAELGRRPGWSDSQFHDLLIAAEPAGYGWSYDPRRKIYACGPCTAADTKRRPRASDVAGVSFAEPFTRIPEDT